MERRALLLGGPSALLTWGLAGVAQAADPDEELVQEAARRAARAKRRVLQAWPDPDPTQAEPLVEGLAALSTMELLMDSPLERQLSERGQALAAQALRALGRSLIKVRRALRRATELPPELIDGVLGAFESDLGEDRNPTQAARARSGVRRVRELIAERGARAALRGMASRIDKLLDLSRRMGADGGWGLLATTDPLLAAQVEQVKPSPRPRARPSPLVLLAGLVAGVLVLSGLILFGVGAIQTSECLCAAVMWMLGGVLVLMGGAMLMRWAQSRYELEQQATPAPPAPVVVEPGEPAALPPAEPPAPSEAAPETPAPEAGGAQPVPAPG